MGFAGQAQRKEAKGDEFLTVFVQNSFFSWCFFREPNEEVPQDETIACCRVGLRELRGANHAPEHETGPTMREGLFHCPASSLLLALLVLSCTLQAYCEEDHTVFL